MRISTLLLSLWQRLLVLLVFLPILGPSHVVGEDEPWEKMFKQAQAVRDQKGPEASLGFFARAIRMQSDQAEMYFQRGKVHHELGGNEKALHDYSTAIALDPTNPAYYFQRGSFWFDRESPEQTDRDMKKALQIKPGYPDAMFFLIQNKLLKEKEFAKAIDACEVVIKNNPEDKRGYYFRGSIRIKLKHYVNAEYDFGLAINLDREYAAAYRYRGVAKMHQGNLVGGMSDLNTAIILRTDYHQAYHDRAVILLRSGDFKSAKQQVDLAIKFSESEDDVPIDYLLTRGRIWHALNAPGAASEDFAQVLKRMPSATDRIPSQYR